MKKKEPIKLSIEDREALLCAIYDFLVRHKSRKDAESKDIKLRLRKLAKKLSE